MPKAGDGGRQRSDAKSGEMNKEDLRMHIFEDMPFWGFIFIGLKSGWGYQDEENKFSVTHFLKKYILCDMSPRSH